jgi:FAD/FMN-containing dehydrogenase
MMHGTFGTLGVLTKLTFQLIPARPWVHVVRQRFDQLDAFLAAMRAHQRADDVDFMDGMIYAPDELVLTVGRFVDEAPAGHGERPRAARDADEAYLATEAYYFLRPRRRTRQPDVRRQRAGPDRPVVPAPSCTPTTPTSPSTCWCR